VTLETVSHTQYYEHYINFNGVCVFTERVWIELYRQSRSLSKNPKTAPNGKPVTKDSGVATVQSEDKEKAAENGHASHAGHVIPDNNDKPTNCYYHAN